MAEGTTVRARKRTDREVPEATLLGGKGRGPIRPHHLRELPFDRISEAPLPRPCLLQRLPGIPATLRGVSGPPPDTGRRAPPPDNGAGVGQQEERAGQAGGDPGLADSDGLQVRVPRLNRLGGERRWGPDTGAEGRVGRRA